MPLDAPKAGFADYATQQNQGSLVLSRVAAAPEDGKANDAVVRLLAETLALPTRDVQIVSGRSSRDKTVALEGMRLEEIQRRLADASGAGEEPT